MISFIIITNDFSKESEFNKNNECSAYSEIRMADIYEKLRVATIAQIVNKNFLLPYTASCGFTNGRGMIDIPVILYMNKKQV